MVLAFLTGFFWPVMVFGGLILNLCGGWLIGIPTMLIGIWMSERFKH